MKNERNRQRIFSTSFKQEKVQLVDEGKISVRELSEIYEVSRTAIYKWVKRYSRLTQGERIVVEKISEEAKHKALPRRIAELERIVGKKQLELDYYKTAIELISEEQGEDLLKKFNPK